MKNTFLISFLVTTSILLGQKQETFLRVNRDSISLSEFKKNYKTNIEAEGFDNAINTYIDFTLLLQKSNENKIDTTKAFKNLFRQNTQPLVDNYLLSDNVTEENLPRIWKNFKTDKKISVYGIGIRNPYDKKLVNEKASLVNNMHKYICKGEKIPDEEAIAIEKSNAQQYWIRPFTIGQKIEQTAYETSVGKCSALINSINGIYFVKVWDERSNTGTFQIQYIWTPNEEKIHEAHSKIENGTKWREIKDNYKSQNYDVKNFYKEDIPEEILNILGNLKQNEVSKPFKYKDNWYIFKLYANEKCNNLNNCKDWISEKLKTTDYNQLYKEDNLKVAKERVNLIEDKEALHELLNALEKDFFSSKKEISFNKNNPIWSTKYTQLTQQELMNEFLLYKNQFDRNTDLKKFTQDLLPKLKSNFIFNTYINHLDKYQPKLAKDFKILRNAIKINHYVDNGIYKKAESDSIGMKKYLRNHSKKYTWDNRYLLEIYKYQTDSSKEKIIRLLKDDKTKEEVVAEFKDIKTSKNALELVALTGKISSKDPKLFKEFNANKKIQAGTFKNQKAVFRLLKNIPPTLMTIKGAGQRLKEEYKEFYYYKTLKKLRENATISIPLTFKQ